ncbi:MULTISPECIES: hypothetical protein [Pseudomonas]|uniref:Uncharacterized protein n=3 Tax=Pseudomonas TaxID=286 RepID=A0A3G1HJP9_PSEAI|nr:MULTISPECIES: hypothetical protein [Pseudomonas]MCO6692573.1 hypothetical protein [Pseudomonas shirazica]HEE9761688.1 hypothetical protein [Pseudomonas putida]AMP35980.1 Hypothetical protein [Pseudomonas aeruginosa]MBA6092356.1 hypothetical protein [Pseudomonas monteilii]MCE0756861.1 hypothetical protein [Pseudomonas asiatica]
MNSLTSKGGDVVPGHTLVLDEHSEGQGQLIRAVIRSRITAGAAVFVVGASIDESLLATMISASTAVGRGADLLIVNPSSPALSHTYNPVLHTAPTKVASHVLNFLADKDATGAYSSAPSAALVRAIVSSLQLAGLPYSYLDLGMFVMKPDAIEALEEYMASAFPHSVQLGALQQACKAFQDAAGDICVEKLKGSFSGLAGSLCMLGAGRAGEVFNSYHPDVVLHGALVTRKIVYLAIPYIGRGRAASNLRRIVISNLADAVARSIGEPSDPTALAVFTDPGGCNDPSIEQLLSPETEQVLSVWVAAGSLDDLGRESLDLREACLSRARNVVLFKPQSDATAQVYSQLLATESEQVQSEGKLIQKLSSMTSTDYAIVSGENQVIWAHVAAPGEERVTTSADIRRPTRRLHARVAGADQFTQTVPV